MRTPFFRCVAAIALLITAGCKTNDLTPASNNRDKLDQLFAQWNRGDSPGASVVIVKDGSVVEQRCYGLANIETRTPITPQTVFDVASVAKQFTGLAVAMLIEQGKLSLHDDIRKHLPEVPDFGRPITIAHLLHHTSGLRDWPETLGLSGIRHGAIISFETILEMVRCQRELDFTPGQENQYCNTSYNLLAAAVAKVSGQSFREYTDANIFQPLGMKHTHFCDDATALVPNRAESYSPAGEKKYRRAISQLAAQGSSSLFVTAEDMAKWLVNFQKQRVGGRSAFERMYQPGKLNGGGNIDYGFGVVLGKYHGDSAINHSGGWAGYRSFVMHIPGRNFGVAILGNAADMNTERLARKISDLYLGHPPPPSNRASAEAATAEAPAAPDPSTWDAYLGTYRLGPGWLIQITRDGDRLHAQATRETRFQMTPVSDTRFFVSGYGAAVEFEREKTGAAATHLLYRGIRAPRLEVPQLTPALLQNYLGDYWSEELRVAYRIELRDGELGVRDRSGEWSRLLPTGRDTFDIDQQRASVEFTRNPAFQVTELKVSGGRIRNIRFLKATLPQAAQGVVVQN